MGTCKERLKALIVAPTGDATKLEGAGVRGLEWEEGERSRPPASTSGRKEEDSAIPMCDSSPACTPQQSCYMIVLRHKALLQHQT